ADPGRLVPPGRVGYRPGPAGHRQPQGRRLVRPQAVLAVAARRPARAERSDRRRTSGPGRRPYRRPGTGRPVVAARGHAAARCLRRGGGGHLAPALGRGDGGRPRQRRAAPALPARSRRARRPGLVSRRSPGGLTRARTPERSANGAAPSFVMALNGRARIRRTHMTITSASVTAEALE